MMTPGSSKGSIVAFEGRPDLILTQLRLLPTSSQLLILPSVESYIKPVDEGRCFDARAFIRQVHDALVARNDAAQRFLDGSTEDHKRLVFLNGSIAGAHTLCVKEIMKHVTNGDRTEAEATFDDIVKDGLADLNKHLTNIDLRNRGSFGYLKAMAEEEDFPQEDPITKAMRAADALDRQTANLQPSDDPAMDLPCRPRSSNLPLYGFLDELEDSTPFYVFGVPPNDEESTADDIMDSFSTPLSPEPFLTNESHNILEMPNFDPTLPSPSIYPASCVGETYCSGGDGDGADTVATSPISEVFSFNSEQIVFGEASVLDIRLPHGRSSISRVRSLDRIHPVSPNLRDLGITAQSWLDETDSQIASPAPHSDTWLPDDIAWRYSRVNIIELPKTIAMRSRLSTVQIQPVPICKKRKQSRASATLTKLSYVDRGTSARDSFIEELGCGPILPAVEDLIIFFKDESPDMLLESAVSTFRARRYSQLSYSPPPSDIESIDEADTETLMQPTPETKDDMRICLTDSDISPPIGDDFEPLIFTSPTWQPSKSSELVSTVSILHPPTPMQTPPPTAAGDNECKVHEFHIASGQTAVSVQNSLRSILGEYFPPDTNGYRQFQFSFLPEFDKIWKPVFREEGPQRNDGVGIQILAIGSQNSVQNEYSQAVIGRLEKVGRKSCEIVQTGRVDFRYLVANAMQAFTTQRLANQTGNPFTNSYLLATLIIPHLETYLTLHSDVRSLLLMYPPEHLATVLALQKLIGLDVMKVAQIVNSQSDEHSPFTHIRGASINAKSETKPARPPFSTRSSSDIAISEANYLLTSTASEEDIAAFVSTVWNIEAKQPQAPEPGSVAENAKKKKRPLPPSPSWRNENASDYPQNNHSPSSTPRAPRSRGVSAPMLPAHEPSSSAAWPDAPSYADTRNAPKLAKSKRSRSKERTKDASRAVAEPLAGLDCADDSEDDMDERRLMPVFMQKHSVRKPNSRKALKFLGLA